VRKVDFDEPQTLSDAIAGVDRVLLISTDSLEPGKRGEQHKGAIEVLAKAGVKHVVYTSLARAEAAALSAAFEGKRTMELTGPAVVTYADHAELASEISGPRRSLTATPRVVEELHVDHGGRAEVWL
jgi:uncharacterized protein YbjT (DUF2867 family)